MTTSEYFFGRVPTVRIDAFAFPRTGSHLFRYATMGLFDLVSLPLDARHNTEAASRRDELDPDVLYALSTREDGVPFSPVWFDMAPRGQHADPEPTGHPTLILARSPMPTVYSLWRVGFTRWRWEMPADPRAWVLRKFLRYRAFADAALRVLAGPSTLLLRFEDLAGDRAPDTLRSLVEFVGVTPKLRPSWVARLIRFDTLTRPGQRTFHLAGDNLAWSRDQAWLDLIRGLDLPDFSDLGYPPEPLHA